MADKADNARAAPRDQSRRELLKRIGLAGAAAAVPAGTLAPGTTHTLRIANVVAQNGPAIGPDPTTMTFTVTVRKD